MKSKSKCQNSKIGADWQAVFYLPLPRRLGTAFSARPTPRKLTRTEVLKLNGSVGEGPYIDSGNSLFKNNVTQ